MKVVSPPKTITVELTEEEATIICALVGGLKYRFDTKAGNVVHELFDALDNNLPDRTESFNDFFEGEVRIRV